MNRKFNNIIENLGRSFKNNLSRKKVNMSILHVDQTNYIRDVQSGQVLVPEVKLCQGSLIETTSPPFTNRENFAWYLLSNTSY